MWYVCGEHPSQAGLPEGLSGMSFWNEGFYFEKHGDRFVYRHTVFSEGYDISASEKDRLFAGLKRLQVRTLLEGAVVIALIALVFMTGAIETRMPIRWFLIVAVLAVALLGLSVLWRRDGLVSRVLGHRTPDVPRLSFKQALGKPRPMVAKRYAIPVLRSLVVLFGLAMAAGDALVAYLIYVGTRSRHIAEGPEEVAAAEQFVALTATNWEFWVAVSVFNALLIACMAVLIVQVRILRATPDSD